MAEFPLPADNQEPRPVAAGGTGHGPSGAGIPEDLLLKLRTLALCALVLVGLAPATASATVRGDGGRDAASVIRSINSLRWQANTARKEAGLKPHPGSTDYRSLESIAALVEIETLWTRRALLARKLTPRPDSVWVALAECESGGNWAFNQGTYDGGLQFHPRTWRDYRLRSFPRSAWKARPMEQILVGYRVLADQGWDAWPACSRKLGLR